MHHNGILITSRHREVDQGSWFPRTVDHTLPVLIHPSLRKLAHPATPEMSIGSIYLLSKVHTFADILPP